MSKKYLIEKPKGPKATKVFNAAIKRPRTAISVINTLLVLIVCMFVLAAHTEVPQTTRAPGALMPFGDYASIEPMDGGIVESVHVRDGDYVEKGQVLLVLTNPQMEREHDTLAERFVAVQQRLNSRVVLFEAVRSTDLRNYRETATLIGDDFSAVQAEISVYRDTLNVLSTSAQRQRQTVSLIQDASDIAASRSARQIAYVQEQADLLEQGIILRSTYYSQEQRLDDFQAAHADASLRLAQAHEQLGAIEAEGESTRLGLLQEILAEIEALKQEHAELSTSLDALREQLDMMTLHAPREGSLQTVTSVHVGEVIEAGRPIFELLPNDVPLVVEARIPGDKMGSVSLHQDAEVTIDAFDVRRVGRISGDVAWISPVPITDERTGEVFFRVGIEIESSTVGEGEFLRDLQSGMTAVVELNSEGKSLLATLIGPVHGTISRAFTDR